MPEFSIIVPVYNRIDFLQDALQSCLDQSFQDFEIIIVNDGSNDQISGELDKVSTQSAAIKVIHKMNEGVSLARNAGIEAAVGNYLIFLDDDDTLLPEMLEKAYGLLSANLEIDIMVCKGQVLDDGNRWDEKYFYRKMMVDEANKHLFWLETEKKPMYFLIYPPLVNAFVYRKEVLTNHKFPVQLPCNSGEDTYLWYELSKAQYVFKVCDWIGAHYRIHGLESIATTQTLDQRLLFWLEAQKIADTKKEKQLVKKEVAGLLLAKKELSRISFFQVVLAFPLFYLRLVLRSIYRRFRTKKNYLIHKFRHKS